MRKKGSAASKAKTKETLERLDTLVAAMNKKYGQNVLMRGSSNITPDFRYPTGSFALDLATGGGWPSGKFVEISGRESSTKTTTCIHSVAAIQKSYPEDTVLWIDAENTTTTAYFENLGVDTSKLLYSPSAGMEESLDLILELQKEGAISLAFIDSLEALEPVKESIRDMKEGLGMNLKQRLYGMFLRKFTAGNNARTRIGLKPVTLIGINQIREKPQERNNEFTPGGNAIRFYASIRVSLRRGESLTYDSSKTGKPVGSTIHARVTKNKTYTERLVTQYNWFFAENKVGIKPGFIDTVEEVIVAAVEYGKIKRGGSWYVIDPEGANVRLQGMTELLKYLRDDPDYVESLKDMILKEYYEEPSLLFDSGPESEDFEEEEDA